ncbi:MAG: mechanosensitive ion channel [Anaerolineales bacterium]|nr:mechanosensitive ion channel [Anaerolineales bacterium]
MAISDEWKRIFSEPVFIWAIQRSITQRVESPQARYLIRKLIAMGGCLIVALLISIVFSDQPGHLTVAFGNIGAGVAFALQEVIASMGSWVSIMLGRYYQVGDRILLDGILGDVITIGMLRTTLME